MIEHINVIEALNEQISAILDIMQSTDANVNIKSIKTAAEMLATMIGLA